MPAIVKTLNNWRWPTSGVPYSLRQGISDVDWLKQAIDQFNTSAGRQVFVPRGTQADYAEFDNDPGANSAIGKQGGMQLVKWNQKNLFHEMGHCAGLGHTYFHSGSRLPKLFEATDKKAFEASREVYADFELADVASMMAYSPNSFVSSPRIALVCKLCGGTRLKLDDARKVVTGLVGALELLAKGPKDAKASSKFNFESEVTTAIPPLAKSALGVADCSALSKSAWREPQNIRQLTDDIDLVKGYWSFDLSNMTVTPADKAALLHLFPAAIAVN